MICEYDEVFRYAMAVRTEDALTSAMALLPHDDPRQEQLCLTYAEQRGE